MKFTILQISSQYISLTPVETSKAKQAVETSRKGLFAQPGTQTVFGSSFAFELPKELKEDALGGGRRLAEFTADCLSKAQIDSTDIVICPDRQNLAVKEYQHAPAKAKFLDALAVLETESVVSDEVSNYSIVNYEYGMEYGRQFDAAVELNAALFAMPTALINDIKSAFEEVRLKVTKIIPPGAAMLHGAKENINSVNRTIALLGFDYTGVRITLIHNGAPVYSQSFDTPAGELAEVVAKERGVDLNTALQCILDEGVLEMIETSENPHTVRSLQNIIDNSSGDIMRNLRMVLLSKKLEIDKIYLCDRFSEMPDFVKYLRQLGFMMEIESVGITYTPENIPIVTEQAQERGFKSSSYFMLSNLVALSQLGKCNFLNGVNSVRSRNSNIGKLATIGFGACAAVLMLVVGGMYCFSYLQQNIDNSQLADPKYNEVKSLIQKDEALTTKIGNVEADKATLPQAPKAVQEVVSEIFEQVTDNVYQVTSYTFDNNQNRIALNFYVDDFDAYVKLKTEVENDGYFNIAIPFSYSANGSQGKGSCTVTLSINADSAEQATQGGAQ